MMKNWQSMVAKWVRSTFGDECQVDTRERGLRLVEEALELGQSVGITREDALAVLQQVYSRPKGEVHQEFGGLMITTLALAENQKQDLHECLVDEWNRINTTEVILKAKRRQAEKKELGL